jgi:copper-containing nitrite reductase
MFGRLGFIIAPRRACLFGASVFSGFGMFHLARDQVMRESPTNYEYPLSAPTSGVEAESDISAELLQVEEAILTVLPQVPPPIRRKHAVRLVVHLTTTVENVQVSPTKKMEIWCFNKSSPGPFIRARQGDLLEVHHTNLDKDGNGHNIDFHAVTGPGGGAPALYAEQGETKVGYFRLLQPGLFFYHCAAGPVPVHVARGMFGFLLVEPHDGLPPVDKEFAVCQSEIYADEVDPQTYEFSYQRGMDENPTLVVFNGRDGALTESPMVARTGERVRIFVGNAGPNLVSSFHIIGTIMDRVYRDGDLISPPARGLQTTLIAPGGSAVIEMDAVVPGSYTLIDHSIFRMEKGCVGFLKVLGDQRKDVFAAGDLPIFCPGCKLH